MKCHTGVDAGSGFVHTVEATAANVHDVTVAAKLLREDDKAVYGDSAYLGIEKREEIKSNPQRKSVHACQSGRFPMPRSGVLRPLGGMEYRKRGYPLRMCTLYLSVTITLDYLPTFCPF